jgi:hypothetical protein
MTTTKLSEQVYFISASDLVVNLDSQNWKFCRDEYYIRKGDKTVSIEDKKRSLVKLDTESKRGVIEVYEPFAVQKNEDGTHEIISGNTRAKAIYQMATMPTPAATFTDGTGKDTIVEITNFEPIPYRLFEAPITLDDAIDFQTSTNDHTEPHTPMEIALQVVHLAPILTERFTAEGHGERKVKGMVTAYLMKAFQRSKQNISQYTTVVKCGTPELHRMVNDNQMSLDNSNSFLQACNKLDGSYDRCDYHLDALVNYVSVEFYGAPEDVKIFKKHIDNYFNTLTEAAKPPASDNGGSVDTVADVGNSVTQEDAKSSTKKPPVASEQVKQAFNDVKKMYQAIDPEKINIEEGATLLKMFSGLLAGLENVLQNGSAIQSDLVKLIFPGLGVIFEESDIIIDLAVDQKIPLEKFYKVLVASSKSVEDASKNTATAETEEIEIPTEAESTELLDESVILKGETEVVEYTVTA